MTERLQQFGMTLQLWEPKTVHMNIIAIENEKGPNGEILKNPFFILV